MAFITLDFETPYGKGVKEGHLLHKYTLTSMTYEEYIFDPRFKVFGVGIKINDEPSTYYSNRVNPNTVGAVLRKLFHEGNDHTVIAHNMMFDGAILSWYYKLSAARYWCTQAMSRGLWNQRSSSLEQLCKSCYPTDESIRKTKEIVLFQNLYELTKEQDQVMEKYCNNDVEVTFKCLQAMYKWMPPQELALLDLTLKMFIHPAFELNPERVQTFLESYNAETKKILDKAEIPRSTLSSPKQFAAWVKTNLDLEIPVIPSPTKNNPDNMKFALGKDEMAFVEFQANHPQHQHIWDARLRAASSIDKSRAERLLAHMQDNGRIAAPLNYAAAHTLRWGGTNKINLQNLRRGSELRKALKAPKGYQVIVADLSNIEGRINAWFCQEQSMLDIFEADGDLYCDFATKIFRRPINKNQHPSERFVGKTCILGLGYQTGPTKLRSTLYLGSNKQINLSLDECKKIVYEDYRGSYSNIVKGWADAEFAIGKMLSLPPGELMQWRCLTVERGRIRLPNGMYLNYPRLTCSLDEYDRPQHSYWNGKHMTNLYGGKLIENIVQALARCVMAEMMVNINNWLTTNQDRFGIEARVILTVHDEVIALAKTDYAGEVYSEILKSMSTPPAWCNDGTLTLKAEGGYADEYSK